MATETENRILYKKEKANQSNAARNPQKEPLTPKNQDRRKRYRAREQDHRKRSTHLVAAHSAAGLVELAVALESAGRLIELYLTLQSARGLIELTVALESARGLVQLALALEAAWRDVKLTFAHFERFCGSFVRE